jgi:hypothetical protein
MEKPNDDAQSDMDIALAMAKLLNDCCDNIEDMKVIFELLSKILSIRFGSNLSVAIKS